MLQRLDFWLAVVVLSLFAYWELHLDRVINPLVRSIVDVAWPAAEEVAERVKRRAGRQLPTALHLKPRPIRGDGGRFDGSLPAVPPVPNAERRSDDRSAVERAVPDDNDVQVGTISPEEAALIGLRLGRGMSASDVAKSLPGYSARKYKTYREKVQTVEASLAEFEPEATIQEAA